MCADVALPADRLMLPVADLSGGQAARAGLAAILLSRFDVLLLDEPTNDLDFAGLDRLEGFLRSASSAMVTVSHDRAFLDRSVDRILEIEEHTHRGVEYAGAWSEYVERRALRRSQARAAYEACQAERSRLTDRIRTQRSWSEQGVRAAKHRPKDNDKAQRGFCVNRTEKQASKVRTSERALARLGTARQALGGMGAPPRPGPGRAQRRRRGPSRRRGGEEGGMAASARSTSRWGGPSGSPSRVLTGAASPPCWPPCSAISRSTPGRRWVGPGVRFGELDQRRQRLDAATPLTVAFMAETGVLTEEARSVLAKFGLSAEHAGRPVGQLSPGERTRAQLAALMVRQTNCLVLDEPTNHLDLPAIEQLEAALEDFAGTLLVVTHDRWLLETLRFDRTIEVGRVEFSTPPDPEAVTGRGAASGGRAPGGPVGSAPAMKIYTRKGDDGTTGLLYGGRVAKTSAVIVANGSVDEAQAALGAVRAEVERGSELDGLLVGLERDLYVLMAELATAPANQRKLQAGTSLVTTDMVMRSRPDRRAERTIPAVDGFRHPRPRPGVGSPRRGSHCGPAGRARRRWRPGATRIVPRPRSGPTSTGCRISSGPWRAGRSTATRCCPAAGRAKLARPRSADLPAGDGPPPTARGGPGGS